MADLHRPRTVVRADALAARLFQDAILTGLPGRAEWRGLAAESFDAAAEFMREAARRNPLTGEPLNEGLPADVEEAVRG